MNLLYRLFPEKDDLIVLDLDLEFRVGINQVRLSPWMQDLSNSGLAEEIFSGASSLFDDVAHSGGLFNSLESFILQFPTCVMLAIITLNTMRNPLEACFQESMTNSRRR